MRPRLSDRQRTIVDETLDGFLSIPGHGATLALRWIRSVAEHPERVGFDPSVRYCGCDHGFRTVPGDTFTVAPCRTCRAAVPST